MKRLLSGSVALVGLALLVNCGCASGCGPTLWTSEVKEELRIELKDVSHLELQTHNGGVDCVAKADSPPVAIVKVTKKGGGMTFEDAKDALNAIDVRVEDGGKGTKRVVWEWKTVQKPSWGAQVAYDVTVPASLALGVVTHNGHVKVEGTAAEAKLLTHNGAIDVQSSQGPLHAETHNGAVTATYSGEKINLITHNGGVRADLSGSKGAGGDITTHNGGITLVVGKDFSADFRCSTTNGRIKSEAPLEVRSSDDGELSGRMGKGGQSLDVATHNGGIRIKNAGGGKAD